MNWMHRRLQSTGYASERGFPPGARSDSEHGFGGDRPPAGVSNGVAPTEMLIISRGRPRGGSPLGVPSHPSLARRGLLAT